MRILRGLIGLVVAAVGLAGCGDSGGISSGPIFSVEGRVLLASGKPLTAGRVTFVAKDGLIPPASGTIGPDGKFSLTTRELNDGAVVGDYKVRIEPPASREGSAVRSPKFPLKYVDEDSSGLVVTVRAEPNRLDPIRLK